MAATETGTGAEPDPAAEFEVKGLEVEDAEALLHLQDAFAEEHRQLVAPFYPRLSLRDWQLNLCCPARVLDEPGSRLRHMQSLVSGDMACYKALHVLRATTRASAKGPARMVGYVMYEVHNEGTTPARRKAEDETWLDVKQIYVAEGYRHRCCGSLLFGKMLEQVSAKVRMDVRLSVIDLNVRAIAWYRSMGFLVDDLRKEALGAKDEANMVVFVYMQRRTVFQRDIRQRPTLAPLEGGSPHLFKAEIVGERVVVDYPDRSGQFEMTIVNFDPKNQWHELDSKGLSLWDGEEFTDWVDVNAFFRDGHVRFHRHLSLLYHHIEVAKRAERKRKAQSKAQRSAEIRQQREQEAMALDKSTRAARKRRHIEL